MAKEEEEEDFTFPTISNTPPRFIDSPPLWRTTSTPSSLTQKDDEGDDECQDDDDEEEKMDVLWEDFMNEEQSKACGLLTDSHFQPRRMVELGCVRAFKLSKAAARGGSGKRPSIVVFVKVLKNLFLLHGTHRWQRKRTHGDRCDINLIRS